jgi:hypothetical protein
MAERLSRHAILLHARCLTSIRQIAEPIVHDHFETFIARQDRALGIGTAVGSKTWFVYDVDPAPHRGSGRRPDRHDEPEPVTSAQRSYVRSIRRTFRALLSHRSEARPLVVCVDGRRDYRLAVTARDLGQNITLAVYPNPKRGPKGTPRSPEAKLRDDAMFPVDQLHQLLRHTCADHKRETIAFGRRLESIVGRAYLIAVWKNFIKRRTERRPDTTTPGMWLGLSDARWRWERLFTRRLFVTREPLLPVAAAVYRKRWTRRLPELRLKHAA